MKNIKRNYNENFTNKENDLFNKYTENETVRTKMMSLYSYFIKHSKDNGYKITISATKFFAKYKRHHFDMSIHYFKKLIYKLAEIGVLIIDKTFKNNTYIVQRFEDFKDTSVSDPVSDPVSDKKQVLTVGTSCSSEFSEIPKYKIKNKDKDIDNITKSKSHENYNSFIEKEAKCTSLLDCRNRAKELLKKYKVKSSDIKNRVLIILTYNYRKVTLRFLDNYIIKLISKARDRYYENWDKSRSGKKSKNNSLKFANFTQRTYDYDKLEKGLLGWECF